MPAQDLALRLANFLPREFRAVNYTTDFPKWPSPCLRGFDGNGEFLRVYWDGPVGFQLQFQDTSTLNVALAQLDERSVAVMQVQCGSPKGNRWTYGLRYNGVLQTPRDMILRAAHRELPTGTQIYTPDGEQKCAYLLGLHGGFTAEQLEDMDFEEWRDGEEVLPRVRRQYDHLAEGWSFGEARTIDFLNMDRPTDVRLVNFGDGE